MEDLALSVVIGFLTIIWLIHAGYSYYFYFTTQKEVIDRKDKKSKFSYYYGMALELCAIALGVLTAVTAIGKGVMFLSGWNS